MRCEVLLACWAAVMVGAILLGACASPAEVTVSPDPSSVTITGVSVVDVERGLVLRDQAVVVVEDRIARIASKAEASGCTTELRVPMTEWAFDKRPTRWCRARCAASSSERRVGSLLARMGLSWTEISSRKMERT